eukprot:5246616-Lingulodinium_polyedra.AAC.1
MALQRVALRKTVLRCVATCTDALAVATRWRAALRRCASRCVAARRGVPRRIALRSAAPRVA